MTKMLVLGGSGLVGSALRTLYPDIIAPTREQCDCLDFHSVRYTLRHYAPSIVVMAAARVGGIGANLANPERFIFDNLEMQTNVFKACAIDTHVQKIIFIASACVYPEYASIPISERELFQGSMAPEHKFYGMAKQAGIMQLEALRKSNKIETVTLIPCNIYGDIKPRDTAQNHVIDDMFNKFQNGLHADFWGTGLQTREFIHASDVARAILTCTRRIAPPIMNCGSGEELQIIVLAQCIAQVLKFSGTVRFTGHGPVGPKRRLLDSSVLRTMGWEPRVALLEGLAQKALYNQRGA